MCTNNSSSWSSALLPVVYSINTRWSTVTETLAGIEDGENLPTPVCELNNDLIDGTLDNLTKFDERIDTEVVDLLKQFNYLMILLLMHQLIHYYN
ncbi:unnamed protein product [Rotaria sp. Silwood2]|nr:unnamed protein product [Rotaria sp. Silwood2]CAF4348041.1 unnamed protein product [Rotaria sp. Silwood2]CAF4459271.1 unnamed protein product [Rotaria sp. Silwood2]